jgi:hypothetical protein
MPRRRRPSKGSALVRRGAVHGVRIAVAGAMAALSGGALMASVAFSSRAGAATSATVPCSNGEGDVYGPQGLVAAIVAANETGGGSINLTANCEYRLTKSNNTEIGEHDKNGLPVVTSSITINGNHAIIARSSTERFRIFLNNGDLTLNDVRITGGDASVGAGIANGNPITAGEGSGHLVLNSSQVDHNEGGMGGGLYNSRQSVVHATSTVLADNTAREGGGIFNRGGEVYLDSCAVSDNTATGAGDVIDGGGILNWGDLTADSTPIENNRATRSEASTGATQGGGIANGVAKEPDVRYLVILRLAGSPVTGNTVDAIDGTARGGGIYGNRAEARLHSNPVSNNTASSFGGSAEGGGIFKTETGSVGLYNNSTVTGNSPNNCHPLDGITGCSG